MEEVKYIMYIMQKIHYWATNTVDYNKSLHEILPVFQSSHTKLHTLQIHNN